MKKFDLEKTDKDYYSAKPKPEIREFPVLHFLTISGHGEPAGDEFSEAVEALYPLAYGIKKICKQQGADFKVPKLEGLWWVDSDIPFLDVPKSDWKWKLLIRMPDFVNDQIINLAKIEVIQKKGIELIRLIQFERMEEGKCIQIMHIGPYSEEPVTLEKMNEFMKENELTKHGLHHEIYLSDPKRTSPEKMKTILRQPVR